MSNDNHTHAMQLRGGYSNRTYSSSISMSDVCHTKCPYSQSFATTSQTPRTARRCPSRGNITYPVPLMPNDIEGAMQLLTGLMPGGRSAPIKPDVTPPDYWGHPFDFKILYAIKQCEGILAGHFVVARRWSITKQSHEAWTEGQVAGIELDSHNVPVFLVDHVDHTYKRVTARYTIREGDQVEVYKGDTEALAKRHQPRPERVAPTMGPAHGRPSRALATPVVHGEVGFRI